ncbi:hypothetical protein POM88_035483 [Heracleum sosnowskyi]|uniref:Uncharacterized protein n=1 Tax=Heracleum sosnowskyi TaxID=360622 RepID=A0AAD8MDB5_9APIA|nr:hypothetical protein POM88_035483 [Heracleum sosnowskyi]
MFTSLVRMDGGSYQSSSYENTSSQDRLILILLTIVLKMEGQMKLVNNFQESEDSEESSNGQKSGLSTVCEKTSGAQGDHLKEAAIGNQITTLQFLKNVTPLLECENKVKTQDAKKYHYLHTSMFLANIRDLGSLYGCINRSMDATSIYNIVLSFSDRVSVGRALDLPVYFGDAGSREVLHKV